MAEPESNERKSQLIRHLFEGLAALAAIATIVTLLFGDRLLDRAGNPPHGETIQVESKTAVGPTAQDAQLSVDLENSTEASSRQLDPGPAVVVALNSIPTDEWCSIGASVLLKRVLRAVERSDLERAADTGEARAQLLVGRGYVDGLFGFSKDAAMAFSFFKRAASSGDPAAVNVLGTAYHYGIGTDPDPYAAVRLYKRASDAGCVNAMYNLGRAYEEGWGGLPIDRTQAARLFSSAAKEGHEPSRQHLAWYEDHP
jgi:hypothetical protein